MRDKLAALRLEALESIRKLLQGKDFNHLGYIYVDMHVPYCAGIKSISADGEIGSYHTMYGQLPIQHIHDLPTDSLVDLAIRLQLRQQERQFTKEQS